MTRRQVWRYKCDHCPKSNCSAPAMTKHEKRCYRNPQRHCDTCQVDWPRPELVKVLEPAKAWGDNYDWTEDEAAEARRLVDELMSAAGDCPACTMAAILQAELECILPIDLKEKFAEWNEMHRPPRDYDAEALALEALFASVGTKGERADV